MTSKLLLSSYLLLPLQLCPFACAEEVGTVRMGGRVFAPAVRLMAGEQVVQAGSMGYACPGMGDVDGDGRMDLLVGEYDEGKIKLYRNLGEGKFAPGSWLMAGGEVASIPGVW